MIPEWSVFALLLLFVTIAVVRREPHPEIPALGITALIVATAFYPSWEYLFIPLALGIYIGWVYAIVVRLHRRPLVPPPEIGALMWGLQELARGHYYKWIDEEEYQRRFDEYIRRFDQEGCDVALTYGAGPDGSPDIHVLVHHRKDRS